MIIHSLKRKYKLTFLLTRIKQKEILKLFKITFFYIKVLWYYIIIKLAKGQSAYQSFSSSALQHIYCYFVFLVNNKLRYEHTRRLTIIIDWVLIKDLWQFFNYSPDLLISPDKITGTVMELATTINCFCTVIFVKMNFSRIKIVPHFL